MPLSPGATPIGGTPVGSIPVSGTLAAGTATRRAPSGKASSPALFTGAADRDVVHVEYSVLLGVAGSMLA